ncbi:MAG: hypothetical protein WAL34_04015 [Acidobacteriaceae bacterium]
MVQVTVNDGSKKPDAPVEGEPASPKPTAKGGIVKITLKDSREVGIRRMGPMDRMRMCSIIGAENSKNELYLSHAVPAYCIASIDGDIVPRPTTVLALEAMAERLGDDGIVEVMLAMGEHFGGDSAAQIIKDFADKEAIKN